MLSSKRSFPVYLVLLVVFSLVFGACGYLTPTPANPVAAVATPTVKITPTAATPTAFSTPTSPVSPTVKSTASGIPKSPTPTPKVNKTFDELLIEAKDKDKIRRNNALIELRKFNDPRVVEVLIEALKTDQDSGIRALAAQLLGGLGDKRALQPLIEALKDPASKVRRAAVNAFTSFKDKQALNGLMEVFNNDLVGVSCAAAISLAKIDPVTSNPFLLNAFNSKDSKLRQCAVIGLYEIPEVRRDLLKALKDEDFTVRLVAVNVLKAQTQLIDLIKNEAEATITRARAISTLASCTGAFDIIELLKEAAKSRDNLVSEAAVRGLAFLQKDIPTLAKGLRHQDNRVRQETAVQLGLFRQNVGKALPNGGIADSIIPDSIGLPFLLDALKDQDASVRYAVVESLGDLLNATALPALEEIARKDTAKNSEGKPIKAAALTAIQAITEAQEWIKFYRN